MLRNFSPNFSKKILMTFLTASLLIVLAHLSLKYVSVVIYNEQHGFMFELANRFDLNDESSVPQWLTHLLFLSISVSAFLALVLDKEKVKKRIWKIIAIAGLLFAIDDVSTLHEFVLQTFHNVIFADTAPTFFRNAWLFILPFVIAALAWLSLSMFRSFPKRTTFIMTLGGSVFILGAVLVDSFINNLPARSYAEQGLSGALEGGLQLLGMVIFLYGIHDYIESRHSDKLSKAIKELRR